MIRKAIVVIVVIVLAACESDRTATAPMEAKAMPGTSGAVASAAQVNGLADELLAHLRETSAYVRLHSGLAVTQLDDITPVHAQREAQFSRDMLARLDAVNIAGLPHDQ